MYLYLLVSHHFETFSLNVIDIMRSLNIFAALLYDRIREAS